ncbi:MAG TPA: sigma-70 family RNA polymerase sigma factor [Candidatus Saccharimonadales bacterium]|jgi:RNA polymerase sigma factor (sigma-70 family)|nr:sigma-70 family RNA polymerase sigma factor [Candidatus Saccharimonadales bacterium]
MAFDGQSSLRMGIHEVQSISKEKVPENPFNAEYLQRLKNHDAEIETHFDAYFRPRLRAKLRSRRLREPDIQDLVHETLGRVLKAVQNDEILCPAAFGGYVNKVCCNITLDFWKDSKIFEDIDEHDVPDPDPGVETLFFRREKQQLVAEILKDLRPKDRNLLRAKFFDHLDTEEMCARFGASSPDHLRLLLHRARKRFARACKKRGLDLRG